MKRFPAFVLPILASVAIVVCGARVRLDHPEMTETQMLLAFWWLWLLLFAVLLVATVIYNRTENRP